VVSKTTAKPQDVSADDAAQLAALGYESRFDRRMGLWENFALGYTYLSPVVGVYSTFALAFVAGGPPMIWSIVIAGLGRCSSRSCSPRSWRSSLSPAACIRGRGG